MKTYNICRERLYRFRSGHSFIAPTCSCNICRSVLPETLQQTSGILLYTNPEHLRPPPSDKIPLEITIKNQFHEQLLFGNVQWQISLTYYRINMEIKSPRKVLSRLLNLKSNPRDSRIGRLNFSMKEAAMMEAKSNR